LNTTRWTDVAAGTLSDEEIAKLREEIRKPAELGSVVSRSLVQLIKNHPAIGWVRSNLVPSEAASQEILKLKKRTEDLEKLLDKARFEPPKGTETLAQGDEGFIINFGYKDLDKAYNLIELYEGTINTTWNNIFSVLSPHMIDEASEASLERTLEEFLGDASELKNKYGNRYERHRLDVRKSDFQTIQIQLRALGLIMKSVKPRSVKDNDTYWTLIPYGDNVMTRLRAIKKENGPDRARLGT
jgi:hypothetical protein